MMKDVIQQAFAAHFNEAPAVIVRSPGRVNIIGEHTDYNDGFVLPAAIDKAAYLAISPNDTGTIRLYARDLDEHYSISIDDLAPQIDRGWPNYILGVVAQFAGTGIPVKGFNALLQSDVPIGAGLSSSAAIECATAFALNELWQTHIDRLMMIKMAQKAEHEYAGVLCGIMDQFASMMGKKDHLIRLDCRSLDFSYVPLDLDGYKILLLNTNVKHSLASSAYNTRRQECKQGVDWVKEAEPGVKSLRDASMAMLDKYVRHRDATVYKRCGFVVKEIERLLTGCEDLQRNDIATLGEKMFETHDGLSKDYEVSCKELDWLVDQVRNDPAVLGARMMGGGFGGCTINIVAEESIEDLIDSIKPAYEAAMNLPLTYYIASVEDGTRLL